MRRPWLLLSSLLLLVACELNDQAPDAWPWVVPWDTAGDSGPAPDAAPTPVDCAVLDGAWQVSLCDAGAVPVQFIRSGCQAAIVSLSPAFNGGTAALVDGTRLLLSLPGGLAGALTCAATPAPTSFTGSCESATGRCALVGVR
jgi:hypothetical protein